jgi:glycosyltransferase involved in cell wall biosynthesis
MKILYLTNGYKPHRWAGTETYTAGIAEEMTRRGHHVEVICAGNWDVGDNYWNSVTQDEQNGIPVKRINLNWIKSPDPFRYLYDNLAIAEYLTGCLSEIQPDVVHVTSCETLSASILKVVKDAGFPLILSLTDFWFLCPRINLLHANGSNCSGQTSPVECLDCLMHGNRSYLLSKKILPEKILYGTLETISSYTRLTKLRGLRGMAGDMTERKKMLKDALALPDIRVTASSFVQKIYLSASSENDIVVQPYGHDLSWLDAYGGKSKSEVIRFGYIGQIIESKGVHLLLQALNDISSSLFDKFSLVIYGRLDHTPSYGEKIKNLAAHFPNVSFGGIYPHDESAKIFSDIDILLVPSIWYDFPLIIYEAFATRTPVIATNLGGMAEAVSHDVNGLLFEKGNSIDLANQMTRVLTDSGLVEKLKRGIPKVKNIQEEANEFEAMYHKILKSM